VRELALATMAFAATMYSRAYVGLGVSKTQVCLTFAAYLLLAPNAWTIFGRTKKDTRKRIHPMETTRVKVSRSLLQAIREDLGPPTGEKYVVIGGAGFCGERIIAALLARGETNIVCVTRTIYPHTGKHFTPNVKLVQADARDANALSKALEGAVCVFAPFAELCFADWMPKHFTRTAIRNVEGAVALLEACRRNGVKRLVYTGSCGSLFGTQTPETGYEDGTPFVDASTTITCYGLGKAEAEKLVLSANGSNGMATTVVRAVSRAQSL
jgi:hypothetical protein